MLNQNLHYPIEMCFLRSKHDEDGRIIKHLEEIKKRIYVQRNMTFRYPRSDAKKKQEKEDFDFLNGLDKDDEDMPHEALALLEEIETATKDRPKDP